MGTKLKRGIQSIAKAFVIAFSMYSKIPMPQFAWKDEDMKYALCFFPWVGAVIAGCTYLWHMFAGFGIGKLCYCLIGAAIPIMMTGGFHVDGFMDTMDAFHSYRPREKKLEILKDSHIGAFAVIMLAVYGLVYLAAFSEIEESRIFITACCSFFLSRCLSGLGVVSFTAAKKEGTLYLFASKAQKTIVKTVLYVQTGICIAVMIYVQHLAGVILALTAGVTLWYYWQRCKKELGGITGDTAGYFVCICERNMFVAAAVIEIVLRWH